MGEKPKSNPFENNRSLLAGIAPGALALSLSAGEALAQAFCVLGWVRGVCSLDLRLLGLRHFLACSSEIAFNLHKLWGIFLLFLQFLFLEFKLLQLLLPF